MRPGVCQGRAGLTPAARPPGDGRPQRAAPPSPASLVGTRMGDAIPRSRDALIRLAVTTRTQREHPGDRADPGRRRQLEAIAPDARHRRLRHQRVQRGPRRRARRRGAHRGDARAPGGLRRDRRPRDVHARRGRPRRAERHRCVHPRPCGPPARRCPRARHDGARDRRRSRAHTPSAWEWYFEAERYRESGDHATALRAPWPTAANGFRPRRDDLRDCLLGGDGRTRTRAILALEAAFELDPSQSSGRRTMPTSTRSAAFPAHRCRPPRGQASARGAFRITRSKQGGGDAFHGFRPRASGSRERITSGEEA